MKKVLVWLVVILAVLVGGKYALGQYAVHVAREAILQQLNDPGSAVFRNEQFYGGLGWGVLCGEVNAKNRMGGYAGNAKFFSTVSKLKPVDLLAEIATDKISADYVNDVCARAAATQ